MTTRDRILEVASSKIGNYGKGSPEVQAIWRDVLGASVSQAALVEFAAHNEWCGGFVLNCLREAGVTDIVGSSRVDLQACKLEYSIVSPK